MTYTILYKRSAEKELLSLAEMYAWKIRDAINNLSDNPRPHGCEKLKGSRNEYRIRIGNYRVIYTISDGMLIVTIIKIAHRKDVYK